MPNIFQEASIRQNTENSKYTNLTFVDHTSAVWEISFHTSDLQIFSDALRHYLNTRTDMSIRILRKS